MGSGAITYIPSYIQIGSGIQKLKGGNTQTHRQQGDLISLCCLFFENKKRGLKTETVDMKTLPQMHIHATLKQGRDYRMVHKERWKYDEKLQSEELLTRTFSRV
jgi:hypothetical protein